MQGKVKERGEVPESTILVSRIGKFCAWIPQFIKEWVNHSIYGRQALCRGILEEFGDEVDGVGLCLSENLQHCISVASESATRRN